MISEVSICNQALTWLGQDPVTTLDGSLDTQKWMTANYEPLRDAVIESRMWRFAKVRAVSETSEKDGWGIRYAHPIPNDWLQVFRVFKDIGQNYETKSRGWQREGDYVLSQDAKVYMWGVQRVTDTGKFTLLFVQTLAARLAADGAIPLTQNRQLQADMWNLYEAKLAEEWGGHT